MCVGGGIIFDPGGVIFDIVGNLEDRVLNGDWAKPPIIRLKHLLSFKALEFWTRGELEA